MRALLRFGLAISRLGVSAPIIKSVPRSRNSIHLCQQRFIAEDMTRLRKRSSVIQSMREFFMHPLTWDRNNGYLNVLLTLAIFSFCFINSCASCPDDMQDGKKSRKE